MQTTTALLLATLSLSAFAACVDDASAPVDDGDDAASVAPAIVGGTCAVGSAVNSSTFNTGGYFRSSDQIDDTCQCSQWQVWKNDSAHAGQPNSANPFSTTCRPATFVEFETSTGRAFQFDFAISTWNVTGTDAEKATMCGNSALALAVDAKSADAGSTYAQIFPSGGGNVVVQPRWTGSDCVFATIGEQDGGSGPFIGGPTYRVRTTATRGLDEFDHGFVGVDVTMVDALD